MPLPASPYDLTAADLPSACSDESVKVVRYLGRVQARVSELVRTQQQQIATLQTQVFHLRAQRMLEQTQALWGLSGAGTVMKNVLHRGVLFGQDQFALPRGLQAVNLPQMPDQHHDLVAQEFAAVQRTRTR